MNELFINVEAQGSLDLPSSRQLGVLMQEAVLRGTGLELRWTAEKLQGNLGGLARWTVPFSAVQGRQGRFILRWPPDLQAQLASRLGAAAGRPEFLGSLLRAAAGRWAADRPGLRLLPSDEEVPSATAPRHHSSVALLCEGRVLEIVFELDPA